MDVEVEVVMGEGALGLGRRSLGLLSLFELLPLLLLFLVPLMRFMSPLEEVEAAGGVAERRGAGGVVVGVAFWDAVAAAVVEGGAVVVMVVGVGVGVEVVAGAVVVGSVGITTFLSPFWPLNLGNWKSSILGRTTNLSNSVLRAFTMIFASRGTLATLPALPKEVSTSISQVGSRSNANHRRDDGGAPMRTTARPTSRVTCAVTITGTDRLCPITSTAISIDIVSVKPP